MPVTFSAFVATNDGTEANDRTTSAFDPDFTLRGARLHAELGWDQLLFAYSSEAPDPLVLAGWIGGLVDRVRLLVAHRPNTSFPTVAARAFATLDRISSGRVVVHLITGGSNAEQRREGDGLDKDERYRRTREYAGILRTSWESRTPFSHHGDYYHFDDFVSDVAPFNGSRIPVSVGGSSEAAYRVGGEIADVHALWGEPLEDTARQIDHVRRASRDAGRADPPLIQAGFRPILGPTDELAWQRAREILARVEARLQGMTRHPVRHHEVGEQRENAGSRRLIAIAEKAERYDRNLWTAIARTTRGAGNSNAIVGSPESVAATLLDYYDLGVRIFHVRGFDHLADAEQFGRQVIPLVRAAIAGRERSA